MRKKLKYAITRVTRVSDGETFSVGDMMSNIKIKL